MKQFIKIIVCVCVVGINGLGGLTAYCAKCAKIEGDRAEEQARNPQPVGYYNPNTQTAMNETKDLDEKKSDENKDLEKTEK